MFISLISILIYLKETTSRGYFFNIAWTQQMICLAVIHNTLCAIIVISTPKIPLKQYLQSCAAITDMELGWKYASFSRYMWKRTERVHHEWKKALEAKNKEQIALSLLPAVPHASFPLLSSVPAQAVLGLGHQNTPCLLLSAIGRVRGKGGSAFPTPCFLSYHDYHVGNERGGRLAPFVPALDLLHQEPKNFIP